MGGYMMGSVKTRLRADVASSAGGRKRRVCRIEFRLLAWAVAWSHGRECDGTESEERVGTRRTCMMDAADAEAGVAPSGRPTMCARTWAGRVHGVPGIPELLNGPSPQLFAPTHRQRHSLPLLLSSTRRHVCPSARTPLLEGLCRSRYTSRGARAHPAAFSRTSASPPTTSLAGTSPLAGPPLR